MNLTKRNKLTALITMAVMIVAVATTCILCIPNLHNGNDNTPTGAEAVADFTINQAEYTKDNTAVAYVNVYKKGTFTSDNGDARILFPKHIYMDISEDLSATGYYIAFDCYAKPSDSGGATFVLFDSVFGLYDKDITSGATNYENAYAKASKVSVDGVNTAFTMMNQFTGYSYKNWELVKSVKAGTSETGSGYVKDQKHHGAENYGVEVAGRDFNTTVQTLLKGKPNATGKYRYDFPEGNGITIAKMRWGSGGNKGDVNGSDSCFPSSFTTTSTSSLTGIDFTSSIGSAIDWLGWDITIYDKSNLNSKIKAFRDTLSAKASLLNSLDSADDNGQTAYKRAEEFINNIETEYLKKREVTQENINTAIGLIDAYTYQLTDPTTTTGNREYNNEAVSISTIFSRYNSDYYDVQIRTVVNGSESGTVSEINNVGTYKVYVAPKANSNGIKLKWNLYNVDVDGNDTGNEFRYCGEYIINPKQFSATADSVTGLKYKVSDWEIEMPGYTLNGFMGGTDKNLITTWLSLEEGKFDDKKTKVSVGGDREGLCAGIGTHRVYFRMTAPNHAVYDGNFTVTIDRADIVLYTKEYGRTYGDKVPTSDEIIDNIIDLNRTSIFDATAGDKKKEYLQQVVTKFTIVDGGREIVVDQDNHIYAAAKEGTDGYNVQLTFNSDDWQDKVANITWAVEGNKACNEQVYKIYKREVDVVWTQKTNLWYDGKGGKRPSATLADSSSGVFLPGAVEALNDVTISGIIQDAGHTVALVNGEAIHAGTYEAKVECADSNYKVKSTTATTTFTIKRRIIDVVIKDRNRTYADGGTTAKDVWATYMGLFSEDDGKGLVYTVSLNNTVLSSLDMSDDEVVTDPLVNSATNVFKIVCDDALYTGEGDGRYYSAGKYTLEAVLNTDAPNGWDYQLGNCTDGVFTVANATVNYTNQDLPAMTFMGKPLDFVLDKDNTDIVFQGWENEHRDGVKIYFAESEAAAKTSTSKTYIQGTDAGTYDVWYRIEAPNHESQVGHVRGHIEATHIYVDVQNTASVIYGTTVPSSADLISMLNIEYYWSTDEAANESLKIENMDQRVAIGVSNGESGGGYSFFNTGDRISVNVNGAGETVGYTVSHYYINGENSANYDFTYVTNAGSPKNVGAFVVNKKDLHVDWTQDGEGWSNVDGEWKYTYSGNRPAIVANPLAEDIAYKGIDKIAFSVNRVGGGVFEASVGHYTATTALTKTENIRNYNLLANSMTFEIIPLTVNIEVDTITRVFGTAQQNPPLGKKIALVDPSDARSIWNYAAGSAQFIGDDYANFCFVSDAITDDKSYKDVNTDGYAIKIVPLEGTTGDITNNYNPVIVNDAKFIITPADIHYMRRQFNISTDEEDHEDKFVTKEQIRAAISIEGISNISLDEFVVDMTDLYDDNPEGKPFIEGNQTREETNIGRYYIYILIKHNRGNFNPLPAIIEVNIQSKWISVTIDGTVEAEYGYPVTPSEDLWAALKDKATITGVPDPASEGAYLKGDAAWAAIKDEIGLFVGSGDTTTKLENNDAVGKYSLYFNTDSYTGDKFFRFLPSSSSGIYTSNVNAYVVTPRTLDVDWQDMDEVFGYHSTSSPSHTYDQHLRLADRDMPNTTIRTQQIYEMKVGEDDWVAVNEHAVNVGEYRIVVTGVNSSNYKLPAEGLIGYFEITAREVTINLSNRGSLEYGAPRAQRGRITEYLNEIATDTTTFTYADGSLHFVGDDEANAVGGLFRYVLASDNGLDAKYNYYSVGTYSINIEELNNVAAKNYKIEVNKQGEFAITAVDVTFGREQFATRVFDGYDEIFVPREDYVYLAGDSAELKKDSTYKVEYKFNSQSDAQYTTQLIVTEVGTHYIDVRVTAPNHNVAVFESRSLTIIAVNVDITMKQATKTYGDTLADMGAATLDEWLRTNCEIKFETYYLDENNQKIPHAVNLDRLNADFEFIVIQNGQGNGDTIVVGNNAAGTYGVSHRPEDKNKNDISLTYRITYAQNGEHTCNWDAYKIDRRDVNVEWVTENTVEDSNNVFEYNGGSAQSIKAYIELVDGTKQEVEFISSRLGSLDKDRAEITFDVGKYRATVYKDESFAINAFFHNYNPIGDTFDYTIVPKSVSINIVEGKEFTYGVAETKVGAYLDNNEMFTADGVSVGTIAQFIKLSIGGNTTKQYYGVGEYDLKVEVTTDNYDVEYNTVKVKVNAAEIVINTHNHNAQYNGKDLVLNVKEHFTEEQNYIIQGDMKWEDAEILYKQEDGTFTADLPVIKGVTSANGKSIDCKVSLDNHITREFTVVVRVAKAELVVKFNGKASSVYGDELLGSDALFAKTAPILDEDASSMTVNLKDLITLKVYNQGAGDVLIVGSYRIDYEFINAADAELYNITLQDALIYNVDQRELKIKWDYTNPFEYDKELHTVNALPDTDSIVAGDENNISIICEGNRETNAGKYTATVTGVTNSNYKLGQTATLVWEIAPKKITVIWVAGDFTYDGNEHLVDVPVIESGLLAGETTEITVSGAQTNAGFHTAIASSVNTNYTVENSEYEFEIKQAALNINWIYDKLTYNGEDQAPTAEVDKAGLIGSDECKVIVGGAMTNAGTHTASATLSNTNYKIAQNDTFEYVIDPKVITFTWNDEKLVYTGEKQAPTAKAEGTVKNDVVEFIIEGMEENAGEGYTAKVVGIKDNTNYILEESAKANVKNFAIGKGVNKIIFNAIPDVVDELPWLSQDDESKPTSTWGIVEIKYYSDKDCLNEIAEPANASEGKYWIKLSVAGTNNYDAISEIIEVQLQGGFDFIPVVLGAVATVLLLAGALAVVLVTNKKNKKQGGAV